MSDAPTLPRAAADAIPEAADFALPLPADFPAPAAAPFQRNPDPWRNVRAAAGVIHHPAWQTPPPDCFLPDGSVLRLTLSRKLTLCTLFPDLIAPLSHYECAFLLFLAAHELPAWNAPEPDPEDGGFLKPLWMRPHAFKHTVDEWADSALDGLGPEQVIALAQRLWRGQHSSQVITIADDAAEKKSPAPSVPLIPAAAPTLSCKSPASSPATIPPATTTPSTSSPSTMPTSSSTPSSSGGA